MPCNSGPMYEEAASTSTHKYRELLSAHDALTAEADELRETLLKILEDNPGVKIPPVLKRKIHKNQVEHRKVDLARLEKTFTAAKDAERLAKVWAADPNLPLEPQLGFNPDKF